MEINWNTITQTAAFNYAANSMKVARKLRLQAIKRPDKIQM